MGPPNPSLARAGIPFVFSGGGLIVVRVLRRACGRTGVLSACW